ncbi:MAG: triose-phosphate isomerase [Bacteroidetes bacterium]|nr:triose-phosphate isomerase [Bacteroidota bacterium]
MRYKIVAGNWKMNKTLEEGKELANAISHNLSGKIPSDQKVVLCPPFVHLLAIKEIINPVDNAFIGAQNCYSKTSGAYTGEVSAPMLQSAGIDYVIIGHSERRGYFNETNAELGEKVKMALAHDLTPIFCCGESLEIRENGTHFDYVKQQLQESIFSLTSEDFSQLVIAYEPIWAIGTGKTASTQQAQEMHQRIRNDLEVQFGKDLAGDCTILYGGSCNPGNAQELFACPDVDGGLIGGASLKADDFVAIVNSY